MPLIDITDLQVRYGRIHGTQRVSFSVDEGEIVSLVGSNGAGKSSTLKAILGMVPYARGTITLNGETLKHCKPSQIVRRGVSLSPEGRRVFPYLSVLENLKVGGYTRMRRDNDERIEQIFAYFPRLAERAHQQAGSMSGGEQQMLAIGRALMSRPKLFLLDEPSLGLAPIIVERIGEVLLEVAQRERLAVILAEQNANWAMSVAQRAVILELGNTVMEGDASELMENPKVRTAYLGI
ncbi:MAG TPA: ABC transporter ATP-binding protein [Paraburkholderia sp.]|jgi:branched-chain amino acid transport system ATP-binding protein